MTNRVNGLFIALEHDIREDDVEVIMNAIRMVKGVADVEKNVVNHTDYFARTKIRNELEISLIKAIRKTFDESVKD
jgi:hypothetical protein